MSIAHLNDTDLYYEEVGHGVPCLVMAGGPDIDHTYLRPWLDDLGDTFRLIYYDHRCSGRSGRPPVETYTYDQLCTDADALRHHRGHPRVAVLGHSSGGMLALQYALRYPDRLSHLILADTAAAFNYPEAVLENARRRSATEEMLATLRLLFPPVREDEMPRLARGRVDLLPLYFHTRSPDWGERLFGRTVFNPDLLPRGVALLAEHDVTSRLSEIQTPSLILVGEDDFITPPSQAAVLHQGLPHSTRVVLKGCGHFSYAEAPDAFAAAIRQWLQQT
jgi:proline iminopeptidase